MRHKYYVAVLCENIEEFVAFEKQFTGIEYLIPVYGWISAQRLQGLILSGLLILPKFKEFDNCSCPTSLLKFVKDRIR